MTKKEMKKMEFNEENIERLKGLSDNQTLNKQNRDDTH